MGFRLGCGSGAGVVSGSESGVAFRIRAGVRSGSGWDLELRYGGWAELGPLTGAYGWFGDGGRSGFGSGARSR